MAKNLLFITADQWRGECLSCLGHMVQTPNLDALAAQGTLFTRHFANTAPCGPSRASIHTGLYQHNHRVVANGTPLEARHTNWALLARAAGYQPALFGYTDTTLDPRDPRDRRVSEGGVWDDVLPGLDPQVLLGKSIGDPKSWMAWLERKGHALPARPIELYTATNGDAEWEADGACPAPLQIPAELHDTWFLVDEVIDYVRGKSGWCVHLSLLRPHPPWRAPAPYNAMYPPDELPPLCRTANADAEAARHPYLASLPQKVYRAPADDRLLRRWQSSYFGLMTEVDHNLGRLFAALKASGAWHDTLIVFTSDHGEQMGDHWLIGKLGYFDQSYAVPLVVFNPTPAADAARGARLDGFTENVDIMPTLLQWLGVDVPAQCDGHSLLPATENGCLPPSWRTEAHWEFDFSRSPGSPPTMPRELCKLNVLRGATFKYVYFPNADLLPPVFFDLAEDPGENANLADDASRRGDVLEAAQKLLSWRMAHDDRGLTVTA